MIIRDCARTLILISESSRSFVLPLPIRCIPHDAKVAYRQSKKSSDAIASTALKGKVTAVTPEKECIGYSRQGQEVTDGIRLKWRA